MKQSSAKDYLYAVTTKIKSNIAIILPFGTKQTPDIGNHYGLIFIRALILSSFKTKYKEIFWKFPDLFVFLVNVMLS